MVLFDSWFTAPSPSAPPGLFLLAAVFLLLKPFGPGWQEAPNRSFVEIAKLHPRGTYPVE